MARNGISPLSSYRLCDFQFFFLFFILYVHKTTNPHSNHMVNQYAKSGLSSTSNYEVKNRLQKLERSLKLVKTPDWASGVAKNGTQLAILPHGTGVQSDTWSTNAVAAAHSIDDTSGGSYWLGSGFTNANGFFFPSKPGYYNVVANASFERDTSGASARTQQTLVNLGVRLSGESGADVLSKQRYVDLSVATSDDVGPLVLEHLSISQVLHLSESVGVAFSKEKSSAHPIEHLTFSITAV